MGEEVGTMLDPSTVVINETTIQAIIKFVMVCIEVIYVLVAFIIVRRVKLMNHSFHTPLAGFFNLAAFVHFVSAVILTIITFLFI